MKTKKIILEIITWVVAPFLCLLYSEELTEDIDNPVTIYLIGVILAILQLAYWVFLGIAISLIFGGH